MCQIGAHIPKGKKQILGLSGPLKSIVKHRILQVQVKG